MSVTKRPQVGEVCPASIAFFLMVPGKSWRSIGVQQERAVNYDTEYKISTYTDIDMYIGKTFSSDHVKN